MFNHIPISLPEIEKVHTDRGHFYSFDGKTYPSITTILHSFPNKNIEIWKSRTPNWEEILDESNFIGTELHTQIESYLKNQEVYVSMEESPVDPWILFSNLKPELDKINNIRCLEQPLYNANLQISGQVDCIAEYDGVLSVIDFKNSRKRKKKSYLKDYNLQLTAYALMFEYCTGQKIEQGINLIADWEGGIMVNKINTSDYIDDLELMVESYEMLSMSK